MQIASIKISNFKGLHDVEFSPSTFGCVVGENNAGKSSILQALVYALNRPPQLDRSLYYDETSPVEFKLTVTGVTDAHLGRLDESHRDRIASIINNGNFILIVRYRIGEKIELKVESLTPNEERYTFDNLTENFKGKRGAAVRSVIEETYPEFLLDAPAGINATQAKEYLLQRIGALPPEAFSLQEGQLPTGISSSITSLLPEPIYIPAVKNINDELKTSQSASFGRLLGLLLEDMTPDLANITNALSQLNAFFNRVETNGEIVDGRHGKVRELESSIEGLLAENFPSVKVELNVPPPELKTILNSAQILVNDGAKGEIENKGDGIKRSLTFALLQCYVSKLLTRPEDGEGEIAPRPILFLFEEPELYLHPKSQRKLFSTLEKMSNRHQVIVTTHSPLFFAPGVTASFVRIEKQSATPKPVGRLYSVNFNLDEASAEVFKLAKFENADAAFFSKRVVLFEGESDDSYFKHVAKLLNNEWDFEAKNVAMVQVSGKGNFTRFRRFFEKFGIQVKLVADLDSFFEGFQHLGSNDLEAPRMGAIQAVDQRIAAAGIAAEPFPRQIKAKVKSESWQNRYNAAKTALRTVQATRQVDEPTLSAIDQLFVWEEDVSRARACKDDPQAQAALIPCIDALRQQGICVLTKGAIEDYYPDEAPSHGSKPDRALSAISHVLSRDHALALSTPLANGRETELVEICTELFRDIN